MIMTVNSNARFESNQQRNVTLVSLDGARRVAVFNGDVMGAV